MKSKNMIIRTEVIRYPHVSGSQQEIQEQSTNIKSVSN